MFTNKYAGRVEFIKRLNFLYIYLLQSKCQALDIQQVYLRNKRLLDLPELRDQINFQYFLKHLKCFTVYNKNNRMKAFYSYPEDHQLDHFLDSKQNMDYNYAEIKGTIQTEVKGYNNDLNSVLLGQSEMIWQKAKRAIEAWKQFPSGWTSIYKQNTPIQKGKTVAVLFRLFGIWWINPAKIVYTFDEPNRFGFAYGTLKGHVEKGEECFWIERDAKGDIYYRIKAFSKPSFWGAKLAYPIARMYQRKFVNDSMAEMKKITSSYE